MNNDIAKLVEIHMSFAKASGLWIESGVSKYIDKNGLDHTLTEHNGKEFAKVQHTRKYEGFEKLMPHAKEWCETEAEKHGHKGLVTAHIFDASADAASFPSHTDPVDVLIYCTHGLKTMVVANRRHILSPGETLFIPANTPHHATNIFDSTIVSIGFEKWMYELT